MIGNNDTRNQLITKRNQNHQGMNYDAFVTLLLLTVYSFTRFFSPLGFASRLPNQNQNERLN